MTYSRFLALFLAAMLNLTACSAPAGYSSAPAEGQSSSSSVPGPEGGKPYE